MSSTKFLFFCGTGRRPAGEKQRGRSCFPYLFCFFHGKIAACLVVLALLPTASSILSSIGRKRACRRSKREDGDYEAFV